MELLIFYPLAGLSVILALLVIFNKSPIASAINLIGMMLALAGIFVVLHAHFLAILQVIIYAGAIMVLFMFVIMLLNLDKPTDSTWKIREGNVFLSVMTGILGLGLLYKFIDVIMSTEMNSPAVIADNFGTTAVIGETLFTDFVLPFEVASILLLIAMVGAVVLAKSKVD